jgi:Cysteine dioxygenase type I
VARPRRQRRRLPDHTRHAGRATGHGPPDGPPRVLPERRDLPAGALRPFGTKHIHKVTNNSLEPAVSLHVYAPTLIEVNAYEVIDGDRLRLAESQLAGWNW